MQIPGFRQAKFLLFSLLRLVLIAPRFSDCTARQTAEKSNVSLGCVASNTVSAIAGREDGASGSSVVASLLGALHSADGDFPGVLMVRATQAGAAHSVGACIAQACGGEHSSVPARFFRACGGGHSAVRAGCGAGVSAFGFGVPCLRRQARSRQRSFVRASDDSSLSSLHFETLSASHAHPFCSHPPLFGRAHGVDVMNSCGVMHDARVNSFGLHSARGNSGDILIRNGVLKIHAVEFGEEQSQGV